MTSVTENEEKEIGFRFLGYVALVVIVIWILVGFGVSWFSCSPEQSGQLGDSFGVVNALFSGLAFAGVICAILMQRQELKLQRTELALTRKVLHQSADAQEISGKALAKQVQIMLLSAKIDSVGKLLEAARIEKAPLRTFEARYAELEGLASEYIEQMNMYSKELNDILKEKQ